MRLSEPLAASWKASLSLSFARDENRSVLARRSHEGPLVVQKPLYPEGDAVCHAIVVHPPGGIAGGDELALDVSAAQGSHALLTTPGAGKWYRSVGAWAKQNLRFTVDGIVEWLPRETIVFDGAHASFECSVELRGDARYIGWEVLCLGRSGSGERFDKGEIRLEQRLSRDGRLLWLERGRIEGGGRIMSSPAGLAGRSVCATMIAAAPAAIDPHRKEAPACLALTVLPGVLIARYLGDSSEEAMRAFTALWSLLRPAIAGRAAVEPRIWRT
ncbi:MAG: urease accessory protein [Betaproteobacteria bacterium]|nr:MAG: urease accessory protein [Betaproteobacteria bacterium]